MNMDFKSAKELLDLCEENQLPISEVMRQRECILGAALYCIYCLRRGMIIDSQSNSRICSMK